MYTNHLVVFLYRCPDEVPVLDFPSKAGGTQKGGFDEANMSVSPFFGTVIPFIHIHANPELCPKLWATTRKIGFTSHPE